MLPIFWASQLISPARNRILKGYKYFAGVSFGVCDYVTTSVFLRVLWANCCWAGWALRRAHSRKTWWKRCPSSCLISRGPVCWLLPPPWEGVITVEAPGRCRRVPVPLTPSSWSLSCTAAPGMPPTRLLWRLEQPLCRAWPIPNPVAQMPSRNRGLCGAASFLPAWGSQTERPGWLILS